MVTTTQWGDWVTNDALKVTEAQALKGLLCKLEEYKSPASVENASTQKLTWNALPGTDPPNTQLNGPGDCL